MYGNGMNNIFCMVEDGLIYQVDTYNKVPIGYTNESYNALSETTQDYYDKLVELGVIVPEKSQEEINQEIMAELAESRKTNKELMELLKSMNNQNGGADNEQPTTRKRKTNVSEQQS